MGDDVGNIIQTVGDWVTGRDRNKEARSAEREQQKTLDDQAEKVHDYNMEVFEAEAGDYFENREFAYNTAITNWEYGKRIQDYQYGQSLAAYEKSNDLYEGQLGYNQQAQSLAVSDQQAYLQDLVLSQAFQREAMFSDLDTQMKLEASNLKTTVKSEGFNALTEIKSAGISKLAEGAKLYGIQSNRRVGSESIQQNLNQITKQNTFEKEAKFVESLQKGGKAALGQAGVSRAKSLQSTAAATFRDLVVLDSSLSGSRRKAALDLFKLQVESSIAETQVGLNLDRLSLGVATAQERAKLNIGSAQEKARLRIDTAKDELNYNSKVLDANMQSAVGQMSRNIDQINLQKYAQDLQAGANLNIFPEEFEYAPEPQRVPERTFVAPMFQAAPTVPKGARVATGFDSVLSVVDSAANIAGQVMGMKNLGNMFGGKNNVLGSLTNNKFGTFADPGVNFGDAMSRVSFGNPNFSSGFGNTIGNFGGNTSFNFSNLSEDYSF